MFSWMGRQAGGRERSGGMDAVQTVTGGLRSLYQRKVLPLEEAYRFHEFHSPALEDADFENKPMILLVGQYSTGKTTFIRYLPRRLATPPLGHGLPSGYILSLVALRLPGPQPVPIAQGSPESGPPAHCEPLPCCCQGLPRACHPDLGVQEKERGQGSSLVQPRAESDNEGMRLLGGEVTFQHSDNE